jgi:hypothetical protein
MNDNELIAEFMAVKKEVNEMERTQYLLITAPKGFAGNWYESGLTGYHESWDWLMPVVDKIDKLHDEKFKYDSIEIAKGNWPKDEKYMDIIAAPLNTTINEVYENIVEFIKWYNQEKGNESL